MNKADVLAGAKGTPRPFEFDGFEFLLRPLLFSERQDLSQYIRDHGEEPGSGFELQAKFVVLAVCDEKGGPLLTREDVSAIAVPTVEAIAEEVARRNGMSAKKAGEPGKDSSPTKN